MRIQKTVGGEISNYYYANGQLAYEKRGEKEFYYLYDSDGNLASIRYIRNGSSTTYYAAVNSRGDTEALYSGSGELVARYLYDSWGSVVSVQDGTGNTITDAEHIGNANPIRYRGYYYDTETEWYYLGSRYYDPEVGRFINADEEISDVGGDVRGYNLYAYCMNDPVNMSDEYGNWPKWAKKVAIGVAAIAVAAVVTVATGGTGLVGCFAAGALKGAIVGGAVGAAVGGASSAIRHRVKTGSWKGSRKAIRNGAASGFASGAISGAISGGITSNVCFVAGTAVLTELGYMAIEDISPGDKVWSKDPETGEKELKEVVQTFVNETDELVHVHANGEEIITTPEHPFYVPKKGWVGAIDLRAGDMLVLQSGEYVIVELIQHEILESPIAVYNFEVEDFHTYYVSKSAVLVHNLCSQRAAMRAAKRSVNIPMSQKPDLIKSVKMTGENGRIAFAQMETYTVGGVKKYIRNDLGGHLFKDGVIMSRHFNAGSIDIFGREVSNGMHFFY